ncbi:bacteriophage lambda NinG family protein [Pectobacterium carotovorum subsp. carotovorum]|nr:bacteriophage lambda NinG family protein [Pectobacterium carotovorum subsp. carotovorum]
MAERHKPPKPKTCPICSTEYTPRSTTQKVCYSIKCAIKFAKNAEAEKVAKAERLAWRKRKADIKPLKHWEDLTQRAVNDYIRERDKDLPCISCGTWQTVQWEAGHYRTRKSAPQIRYNEDNIAKQCHRCNVELSGNQQQYRINLVAKIGEQRVIALDHDNTIHRYTREELESLRAHYRALTRALIKQREAA